MKRRRSRPGLQGEPGRAAGGAGPHVADGGCPRAGPPSPKPPPAFATESNAETRHQGANGNFICITSKGMTSPYIRSSRQIQGKNDNHLEATAATGRTADPAAQRPGSGRPSDQVTDAPAAGGERPLAVIHPSNIFLTPPTGVKPATLTDGLRGAFPPANAPDSDPTGRRDSWYQMLSTV